MNINTKPRIAIASPRPIKGLGRAKPAPQGLIKPPSATLKISAVSTAPSLAALKTPPPPIKALGRVKPVPSPIKGLGRTSMTVSPVIAPDGPLTEQALPVDIAPEQLNPSYTVPAENPYAPEAEWVPMEEVKPVPGEIDTSESAVQDFVPDEAMPITKVVLSKKSWFDKVLEWFGLARKSATVATMAGEAASMATMSQTEAAAQLVRRARNGDQNAMALIACVRDAAEKGNTKAIISARFMHEYIKTHPVGDTSEFGIEHVIPRRTPLPSDPATAAAVALSHGPILSRAWLERFVHAAHFGAEEVHAFKHGVMGRRMRNPNEKIQKANHAGRLIRHARKLQAVRMPNTAVSRFDANIGWELGEDIE